jgi:endonuclease YncB( thermonuclease family)
MTATPSPPHRAPLRPRRLFGLLDGTAGGGSSEHASGAKAGGGGAPQARANHHLHAHAGPAIWSTAGAAPRTTRRRRRSSSLAALAALLALATAGIALARRTAADAALAAAAQPGVLLARPAAVRVLDGDTLDVARVRIRLLHMDAPEGDQACGRGTAWQRLRWPAGKTGRNQWACGDAATAALARLVRACSWVECTPGGRDVYGRTLASCDAVGHGPAWWAAAGRVQGRVPLAAWMVERGWAVAYGAPRASGLKALEQAAKAGRRGVWADAAFERPAAWRKRVKQQQQQQRRRK